MEVYRDELSVRTSKRLEILDITDQVKESISRSGILKGFVILWEPHTTATIAVNEGDPELWQDILDTFTRLVPIDRGYRHNAKYRGIPGEQNAHAHILNCLCGPSISIPLVEGRLTLGTWQRILFIELDGPRSRRVFLQVVGE